MKKNGKNILRCLIFLLAILLPFGAIIAIGENVDDPYEQSFSAALADKYDRLCAGNGGRIIFVGGSSLPFGLRSDIIADRLGYEVADLGVYAALGTKAMCEIALDCVKSGDIIVLAPELDSQTYSLYFNAEYMWQAVSGAKHIIGTFSFDERLLMYKSYLPFLIGKIRDSGSTADVPLSVYSRSAFNEYGDIAVDRPCNIMAGGVDSSSEIALDGLINEEFIGFVNEFTEKVAEKGGKVYFTFSPVNAAAAAFSGAEGDMFADSLSGMLDAEVLGSPAETTYEPKYFYNTNFHLNSSGALLHTKTVCRLLGDALGTGSYEKIEITEPGEGTGGREELPDSDENEIYFVYTSVGSSYYLESVAEEYRESVTSLTLPVVHDGIPVTGISGGCFDGCTELCEITIPEGYCVFDSGIFGGCPSLTRIYIGFENPGYTSVPSSGLFDGASDRLKVYIRSSAWSRFVSDYSWRAYKNLFEKY